MKTIWKYQLEVTDRQEISMPTQAKILTVQTQNNILTLWVEVDTDANYGIESRKRVIQIIGTGNPFPPLEQNEERKYIGTCQMQGLVEFVWHVFEIIEK
jgi:hypothetical protein